MWRTMRMAAFAAAVTLVLGGFALAHDGDDYYYGRNNGSARQYGYQNGYSDGVNRGLEEGRERDRYDGRNVDWNVATRGYQPWMGPVNQYRDGYVDGYHNGFQEGFRRTARGGWNRGDGDRDRDDGYYRDGNYRNENYGGGWYDGRFGNREAYNFGFQDGANVAREDMRERKPYNPEPRGRYNDRDHGFRREYGDRNAYRAAYTNGYRSGYQSIMNRRY
jgi:hypothetical protein